MSRIDALQITPIQSSAALSPAQKRFNTLLRQIEKARASLTAWQEGIAAYRLSHAQLRKLPRQVDNPVVETSALNTLGRNTAGGTLPRDSCGRHSL